MFFCIIVIPSLYNCQHSFAKENLVFNLQNKNIDIVKAFSKICILIHHLFLAVDSNTWNENKFYCFCLLIIFTVVRMKYFISFENKIQGHFFILVNFQFQNHVIRTVINFAFIKKILEITSMIDFILSLKLVTGFIVVLSTFLIMFPSSSARMPLSNLPLFIYLLFVHFTIYIKMFAINLQFK